MSEEAQADKIMVGDGSHPSKSHGAHSVSRLLLASITGFLLLAGVTALVVWLVYRPSKPEFSVAGAAIYELTTNSSSTISTAMQFTVVTHNPNRRVSIYYDRLSAYVAYRGQAITPQLQLPPLVQGHKVTVAMSPLLGGEVVPVSPEVAYGLEADEAYGVAALRWMLWGRLKYKAGPFWSGCYGLVVRCNIVVGFRKGFMGQVPLLGSPDCIVNL